MNTKYNAATDILRHEFPRSDSVNLNWSQAYQDLVALTMTRGKKNGKYVEIGANHPSELNNTILLETSFDWKGVSVEIDGNLANLFNKERQQPCFTADATTCLLYTSDAADEP